MNSEIPIKEYVQRANGRTLSIKTIRKSCLLEKRRSLGDMGDNSLEMEDGII